MYRFLSVILVLLLLVSDLEAMDFGLRFNTRDCPPDKGTCMTLGDEPFEIDREFKMGLYLNFYETPIVGNIVSIETDDDLHVAVIATEMRDRTYRLGLVVDGCVTYLRKRLVPGIDREDIVDIILDKSRNTVSLRMLSSETSQDTDLSRSKSATVTFGAVKDSQVPYVAPFELRNIRVFRNNINTHYWDFKYYDNDSTVFDEMRGEVATVRNPHWLIDDHVNWTRIYRSVSDGWIETEFSSRYDMFSIIDRDSLFNFNPLNGLRSTASVNSRGREIVDDPLHRFPYLDEHTLMRYNVDGMGSNVVRYDMATGHVNEYKPVPPVVPSRQMAVAAVNDRLYIFSRTDSVSEQSRGGYVLYEYDATTWNGRVLWFLDHADYDFSPTPEMYYESEEDCFFFASVANGGCVVRISRSEPVWSVVSMSAFPRGGSDRVNLYRGSESNRYHLVANRNIDSIGQELSIYTIAAPFIRDMSEVVSRPHSGNRAGLTAVSRWLVIVAVLVLIALLFIVWRRRGSAGIQSVSVDDADPGKSIVDGDSPGDTSSVETDVPQVQVCFDRSRSSISLLGGFSVRDKDGNDITIRFTTRLKHLLVMLLLPHDGTDYRDIDSEIWGDKDDKSAQNNRNVSMRKLRLLLEDVGDMAITYDKGVYRVNTDGVMIDYMELMSRLDRLGSLETAGREEIDEVLALLSIGPLLPDTSFYWLDSRKAQFSDRILSMLNDWLSVELDRDDNLAYRIAEVISLHNPLSEEALRAKCLILMRRDMPVLADNIYTQYCSDYQAATGHAYARSITAVCNTPPPNTNI